jgi:uncharacterized membrane protein
MQILNSMHGFLPNGSQRNWSSCMISSQLDWPRQIVRWFACTCLGLLPLVSQAFEGEIVDFEKDIAPLLVSRCLNCHEGDEAKNDFRINDRKQVLEYAENGLLWNDYLKQPSRTVVGDSPVMPPDGPLPAAELSLLKLWLDEGAKWPDGVELTKKAATASKQVDARSGLNRFYQALGYFHPAVVHFPIALLALAGVCAFLSYFLGKKCESIAFHLLWIGVLSSFLTVVMGWAFADIQGYPSWNKSLASDASHSEVTFYGHRWLGTAVSIVGTVVFVISIASLRKQSRLLTNLWRVGAMALALLVGIVGHQGGELKYGDIFEKAWKEWKGE